MKDVDRSHAFDNIPKWVDWTLGACALSAYVALTWSGRFSEGTLDFAMVSVLTMAAAVWYFRDLWHRIWFWLIVVSQCLLHVTFVAMVRLPPVIYGHGTGGKAAVGVWLFDFGFVYGCIRFAERWSQGWPKTIEVPCRVCGADVDKHAVQCLHCGAWSPAPPSQWIVLIALAPCFLLMLFVLFFIGDKPLPGGH